MSTWYVPKLKQTVNFQKELFDELQKIREDAELLPQMFRAEAADRDRIRSEMMTAKDEAKEALAYKKRMQNQISDLEQERDRKKQLSIQAMAARSNVKQCLDDANKQINMLER